MKPMPASIPLKVQKDRYRYFQKRVPLQIMRTIPAERRKQVLGTTAGTVKVYCGIDEKGAQRKALQEWARLEGIFAKLLGKSPTTKAASNLSSDALDALSYSAFKGAYERGRAFLEANPDLDPSDIMVQWDLSRDHWRDGLQDNDWDTLTSQVTDAELHTIGVEVPETCPEFLEARRTVARAILEAYKKLEHELHGDRTYVPSVKERVYAKPAQDDHTTLTALFGAWKADRKPAEKTVIEFEKALRRFTELHGDIPAITITKAMVRGFKEALRKLPSTLSAKQRAMALPNLLEDVEKAPPTETLSDASINKHLAALSAVLKWAGKHGYFEANPNWSNPAADMKVEEKDKKARLPFSPDDLNKLFGSEVFVGRKRPRGGGGEAAKWLPLVALLSGARLEELGQALTTDVRNERGIWLLDLNTLDEGKTLKNKGSRRTIPLHPELIRCGFLRYAKDRGKAGTGPLFPDLKPDVNGRKTGNWSKWFNRYKTDIGICAPANAMKDFHSFRHGFKDACRAARIEEEVHDALTGHSGGGVGRSYGGNGVPLDVKAEAVKKIAYPGVKLDHLYVKDVKGEG